MPGLCDADNFKALSNFGKVFCMIILVVGRLEIFALLVAMCDLLSIEKILLLICELIDRRVE
ncbi:MAG: hypothetical protein IJK81_06675 [Selenomonadaceae bacterium]|nr:hypothetical protein [Selenomonadaceae bacterium]